MTKLEKKLIKTVADSLIASVENTDFVNRGDLNDWIRWARRMKASIANNVKILITMAENPEKEEEVMYKSEEIFSKKKNTLLNEPIVINIPKVQEQTVLKAPENVVLKSRYE